MKAPMRHARALLPNKKVLISAFWEAMFSSANVVLIASFIGFGVLAHAIKLPIDANIFLSTFVWALPSQIVFLSSIENGANWWAAAFAVALSAVRILPMVITIMPHFKHEPLPNFWRYVAAHFVAVTGWVEGMRRVPKHPKETALSYFLGLGLGFLIPSVLSSIAGFYAAPFLPNAVEAALLFLTPLFFALAIARTIFNIWAALIMVSSFALVPIFHAIDAGTDLLWTGLIIGTALFLLERKGNRT